MKPAFQLPYRGRTGQPGDHRRAPAIAPRRSWSAVRRLVENRHVEINGNLCTDQGRRLKAGDVVKVWVEPRRSRRRRRPGDPLRRRASGGRGEAGLRTTPAQRRARLARAPQQASPRSTNCSSKSPAKRRRASGQAGGPPRGSRPPGRPSARPRHQRADRLRPLAGGRKAAGPDVPQARHPPRVSGDRRGPRRGADVRVAPGARPRRRPSRQHDAARTPASRP